MLPLWCVEALTYHSYCDALFGSNGEERPGKLQRSLSRIGSIVAVAMDHSLSSLLQEKEPISAEIAKVDGLEASGSHTQTTPPLDHMKSTSADKSLISILIADSPRCPRQ